MISKMFKFGVVLAALAPITSKAVPQLSTYSADWPPFIYSEENQVRGIAFDIMEQCVLDEGFKVVPHYMSINKMFSQMKDGSLDINVMSFKKKRSEFMIYGKEPLFANKYVPFVKRDSTIKIDKISDFDQLSIVHLKGLRTSTEYFDYLQKRAQMKDAKVDFVKDIVTTIKMLSRGRVDTFVAGYATTLWYAKKLKLSKKIKPLQHSVRSGDYFLTVSKKSKSIRNPILFAKKFDRCVVNLKKSGEMKKIVDRYLY